MNSPRYDAYCIARKSQAWSINPSALLFFSISGAALGFRINGAKFFSTWKSRENSSKPCWLVLYPKNRWCNCTPYTTLTPPLHLSWLGSSQAIKAHYENVFSLLWKNVIIVLVKSWLHNKEFYYKFSIIIHLIIFVPIHKNSVEFMC